MPLTQNAPREDGCTGLGAILVTLPSSIVSNEPHKAEHSQQVLGTVSVADTFEGRTFIVICPRVLQCHTGATGAQAAGCRSSAFVFSKPVVSDNRSPSMS